MNRYLLLVLVLIVIIIIILSLEKMRNASSATLDKILYVDNNPKLYLKLLENNRLRILYSKNTIEHFKLNAYLMMNDKDNIKKAFSLLDNAHLSKGEKLEYNMKKLSFYALDGNKAKTKDSLDYILANTKDDKLKKESKLIYEIYINKNINMINELKKDLKNQNGQVKGLTLFRIAKLYYFNNNTSKAIQYLNESYRYLNKTIYEYQVNQCLEDTDNLNKY